MAVLELWHLIFFILHGVFLRDEPPGDDLLLQYLTDGGFFLYNDLNRHIRILITSIDL
jgi:hypothetical protein